MSLEPRALTISITTAPTTSGADEIALAIYRALGAIGVVIVDRAVEIRPGRG